VRVYRKDSWSWVGGVRRTDANGYFRVSFRAGRGSLVRVWSSGSGLSLTVRAA
jgi:hypothetical protein